MHRSARGIGLALSLWTLGLMIGDTTVAEEHVIGSLPGRPAKAGFNMSVSIEAVGGNGYQPVYLKFLPTGRTFVRDRYLQVSLGPREQYRTELDFDLNYSLKIPEGSTSNRYVLYVPHYYSWNALSVSLSEEGREIETGSGTFGFSGVRPRFAKQVTTVGVVMPTDQGRLCPDVRTLMTVLGSGPLPVDTDVKRLDDTASRMLISSVQPAWVQFRPIAVNEAPENWLGYSQLDIIVIAEPDLAFIEKSSVHISALKNWLAAGGNLWVYGNAKEWTASLLTSTHLQSATDKRMIAAENMPNGLKLGEPNDTSALIYEGWNGVMKASQHYSGRSDLQSMSTREKVFMKLKSAEHPFAETVGQAELAGQIRFGSFGAGKITTIDSGDPFPGSFQLWGTIANEMSGPVRLQWTSRNGIDVPLGNDNYWIWLIGSVGQPPVKSFVLLNTLFVIIVGPLCYFLFRRHGRLYLLYFFAPALAAVVTVGLFAYALAADGTRTKARVRQVTWLDLGNGYATHQSRQTYYAVFGGGDGLEFSNQTAVYPVRYTPVADRYYRRGGRSVGQGKILIGDDSQRLSGSFLPPRNQVQYLVTEPEEIGKSISFDLSVESAAITNHLSYPIDHLLIHDTGERYLIASNVNAGATAPLRPATREDIKWMLDERVVPLLGDVPVLRNNRGWGGTTPGMQLSELENRLQTWQLDFPRRSFVALAEVNDDQLGAKDAVIVDSVHVLMGEIP